MPPMTMSRAASAGMGRMMAMMDGESGKQPPFAPPFLQAGKLVIAQTANILFYLGAAPETGAARRTGAALAASVAARRSPIS